MTVTTSRILLVESREEDASRLQAGLGGGASAFARAVDVVRAATPREARLQLLVGDFDAVLMCVENPELAIGDLAVLTERVSTVPVLVYGPSAPHALRDRIVTAGAADYLSRGAMTRTEVDLVSRCLHYSVDRRGILAELENARRFGEHLAHHDGLTGLPNSRLFSNRLRQLIAQARRYPRQLAVLFVDIDRFKPINETLGADYGDLLLVAVAERLTSALRESDTVARRSGDDFTVILDGVARAQDAARVAKKIQAVLARPYVLDDREIVVDTSIGISLFPADGEDHESLIKHADIAMNRAKGQSGNSIQFYLPAMNESAAERLHLEQALRTAIEQEQFIVHYQPQVDLVTGRVSGMEALVRWAHPTEGLIAPDRFIPMAEETGLIVPLGEWVLRTACHQNKAWQDAGLPHIPVAVNLSARQFQSEVPAEWIGRALEDSGLSPASLDLELTESTVMTDADVAIDTLERMRSIGVRISIDDFGTGHSSLSYLKRFPFHRLKIDKAFVRSLLVDRKDEAITRAIIGMANNLELKAVAEGVETFEQLEFLRGLGCDEVQGFLVSRPMPSTEAGVFLGRESILEPSLN
jgi:diguanylate cyclase (GGDEF)-like protein